MTDEQFRYGISLGTALGYDELEGTKKDEEDIKADLDYRDRQTEDFLTNLATGGAGVGTTRTEYDPTITQSGAVTHTVTFSEYRNVFGYVFWSAVIVLTAAGTGNNAITLSLPVNCAAAAVGGTFGIGDVVDTSTAEYPVRCVIATSSTLVFRRVDTAATSNVGVDPNFALANTDVLHFSLGYPAG